MKDDEFGDLIEKLVEAVSEVEKSSET